ncbi:unnamed protein product [Urochloa decumbens]|uniref:Uncharacterized protein n=1 Tax=Urochloa decumbens TaxID=240449 RepID=A0ABC8Y7V3_9POAL
MDDDIDSSCSTPFASAPSSPGRSPAIGGFGGGGGGYFFSAPASPIHHLLFSTSSSASAAAGAGGRGCAGDAEFEFGGPGGPMISADELFHNGQIRPLTLPPLPDLDPGSDDDEDGGGGRAPSRGRDLTPRSLSVHRRARSMSPLRSASPRLKLINALVPAPDLVPSPDAPGSGGAREEAAPPVTASSRSSSSSSTSSSSSAASSARGSRRWVFIKDMLLHRSRSEPGSGAHANANDGPAAASSTGASKPERAWPFSPSWAARDRLAARLRPSRAPPATEAAAGGEEPRSTRGQGRGRRRRSTTVAAAHERLYAAPNRAQAEEMRRRTFLPYRQGLLGCLGFSSRGYGALHGLTKTLNPVFSR